MTAVTEESTTLTALEARLRRLEDQDAIWRLFQEYRRQLDRRDFAAYAQLFTEDGEWLGNLGTARGPAEIEQLLIRTLEGWSGESTAHLHLVDNAVVDVDVDAGRATAESTWVYITRDFSDNPVLSLIGHYRDVVVRTDAGWKFRRREAYLDFPYQALDLSG
jgi:ketosteroid isomerase-like protein